MPQIIIWQAEVEADATASAVPLDYLLNCPTTADVPLYLWYERSEINLRLTTQLELDWINEPADQTFNNPTEYRGGVAAFQANGYVFHRDYLTYARQLHNYDLPPIAISGGKSAEPILLRNTTNTLNSHAYSLGESTICGTITEPPLEVPVPSNFAGSIPAGAICLRVVDGQKEFIQIPSVTIEPESVLTLNLASYFHAFTVSGIVRGGFRLTIRTTLYALHENSNVEDKPVGTVLRGNASYPVYSYTCSNGFPVSDPTNPPCIPPFINTIIDAGGQFGGTACTVEVP